MSSKIFFYQKMSSEFHIFIDFPFSFFVSSNSKYVPFLNSYVFVGTWIPFKSLTDYHLLGIRIWTLKLMITCKVLFIFTILSPHSKNKFKNTLFSDDLLKYIHWIVLIWIFVSFFSNCQLTISFKHVFIQCL